MKNHLLFVKGTWIHQELGSPKVFSETCTCAFIFICYVPSTAACPCYGEVRTQNEIWEQRTETIFVPVSLGIFFEDFPLFFRLCGRKVYGVAQRLQNKWFFRKNFYRTVNISDLVSRAEFYIVLSLANPFVPSGRDFWFFIHSFVAFSFQSFMPLFCHTLSCNSNIPCIVEYMSHDLGKPEKGNGWQKCWEHLRSHHYLQSTENVKYISIDMSVYMYKWLQFVFEL